MRPIAAFILLLCLVAAPLSVGLAGYYLSTPCPIPMAHAPGCATVLGHALHVRYALEAAPFSNLIGLEAHPVSVRVPPPSPEVARALGPPARPTALQEQFAAGTLQRKEAPYGDAAVPLLS